MSGAWLPVVIVALVMVMIVMKSRYRYLERRGSAEASPQDRAETARLQEEVRQLKDRIRVLERITVEKEGSLNREIEELRDR